MRIGILGLQGDFEAHARMLEKINVTSVVVKKAEELKQVEGLILPGGESSAILKLMEKNGLVHALRGLYERRIPVYGTCAGVILLARCVLNGSQYSFGMLDVDVERNAYGRQIDSFETEAVIECVGGPIKIVFIRAPIIRRVGRGVDVLAIYGGHPVMVRQGRILGTTFHPEMTEDPRIHQYFIRMVESEKF
jgi:5'-phosphate synthase pdxT subunit